ncbi:MAG: SDR family oxidoreductase [Rhizobiales bacterium]|nr:SDR family oxidoreductase [Hyphomicrobiales bacterium]MBO6697429.1 SDR family oxidoreductase [Hyphomicrobiales bacterium]MBO6736316.1 SDR family oxidoreductase [Hyphomicrobiales bacterium]MBO6912786.1 SDR family oxidoreductase [Hyphomicrobiales bacterium]MBO6953954.1 SDR family oxidoreductase [Hyphomicrobiales bacterium]
MPSAFTNLPPMLITGAANRIGKAMASQLAASGTPVCIHYRSSEDAAHQAVASIKKAGGTAAAVQADLLNDDDLIGLVGKASDALGAPLGCLVNNASMFKSDEVGDLGPDLFKAHFGVHATAPALLADQFVKQLPQGSDGLIVNIIDQRVWKLTPNFVSYTASKVALWGLTQTLAQAFAATTEGRVRVNAIGPGPTLSNERQEDDDFKKQVAGVPLKRSPDLDAFAQTITYLWRMKAVTGQMIALDGGQHLAWETPDVAGINE